MSYIMEELRTWNFEDHEVRTVEIDGEPWFVGKDVATVLGYQNGSKALSDHVDAAPNSITNRYRVWGSVVDGLSTNLAYTV